MPDEIPVKPVDRNRDAKGRFLPGNQANVQGRPPKDQCITSLMRDLLTKDPEKVIKKWEKGTKTGAMRVAIAWFKKLAASDMTALKEALDRVEGKVPQTLQHTGKDGHPIGHREVRELTDDELDARIAELEQRRAGRARSAD